MAILLFFMCFLIFDLNEFTLGAVMIFSGSLLDKVDMEKINAFLRALVLTCFGIQIN